MNFDRDGKIKIDVSADEMTAVAFVTPPDGDGKAVTVPDVKRALENAGVVYGIVSSVVIQAFLEEASYNPAEITIAAGTPTGHGKDATLANIWLEDREKAIEDESGNVNLRELNVVRSLRNGEIIARKTHATRGEEGTTVTGKKTPGEWGTDIAMKAGLNTALSEDGTELMATCDGSPRLTGGVINVDPVFMVNGDVDYSTGNIDFAGALEIRGNIQDGFSVKAKGNITIGGSVQASQVVSGGYVMVRGGILTRNEGTVIADGGVRAKFIENSIVEAGKDIIVERSIINSSVRSNGKIFCTSQEGRIIGGDIMAYQEIRARNLGTETETKTILRSGLTYDLYKKLSELELKLEKLSAETCELKKSMPSSKSPGSMEPTEIRKKLAALDAERIQLQRGMAQIRSQGRVNPVATVKGEQFIHPGCIIYIGGASERITKLLKYATFIADKEGGIALSSYDELTRNIKTTSVGPIEKKKTVMIVDDTKFMRNKLRNILEGASFKVMGEAEDGLEAVSMFKQLRPDVVTMDITMPNMDGIASLMEIKKYRPDAKVVMISALGQKEKIKDSIVAGASDFILKPFVPERVLEVVTRVANK